MLVCRNISPSPSSVQSSKQAHLECVSLAHQVLIPSYDLLIPMSELNRRTIPFIANSSEAGFIAVLSHRLSLGLVNLMLLKLLIIFGG